MTEQATRIRPTVLFLDQEGDETLGFVTAFEGEDRALMVFRGPQDAFRFQHRSGRHTLEEGYVAVSMDHQALDRLLAREGIGYVAMPDTWTGKGRVDLFTRGNFFAMLEESQEE